ncbi:hypothetical protein [Streptomyces kronopolitis]|uniref:hypothetical protein n=1 Tax=Streptomyces kronopolitis TaxID=1612435 RepID=UPI0034192244
MLTASNTPFFRIVEVDGGSQVLFAQGWLTLSTVTISNGDVGLGVGGGIANLGGSVTITAAGAHASHPSYCGGIYTDTALTMTASSVTGHTAGVNGGGIYQNAGSVALPLLFNKVSGNFPNDCAAPAPLTAPC